MKILSLKGRANTAGGRRLGNHRGAEGSEAAAHAAKDQMLKQRVSEAQKHSCCWLPRTLSSAILNG